MVLRAIARARAAILFGCVSARGLLRLPFFRPSSYLDRLSSFHREHYTCPCNEATGKLRRDHALGAGTYAKRQATIDEHAFPVAHLGVLSGTRFFLLKSFSTLGRL